MSRHDALRRIRNEQTRSRRLLLERLEDRFCLCTTSHGFYLEGWGPNNEYVTWLKFECTPSDDVILDIDVPGGETTIHWESRNRSHPAAVTTVNCSSRRGGNWRNHRHVVAADYPGAVGRLAA